MGKIIQLIFKSTIFCWMFTEERCQQKSSGIQSVLNSAVFFTHYSIFTLQEFILMYYNGGL